MAAALSGVVLVFVGLIILSCFQAEAEAKKAQELEQLHERVRQTFGKKDALISQLKEQLAAKDLRIKVSKGSVAAHTAVRG